MKPTQICLKQLTCVHNTNTLELSSGTLGNLVPCLTYLIGKWFMLIRDLLLPGNLSSIFIHLYIGIFYIVHTLLYLVLLADDTFNRANPLTDSSLEGMSHQNPWLVARGDKMGGPSGETV